ncbi:MAG: rhodanese-like domain-containing protein [Gemmatimonadota bacterium]|jgi:adenylyltransferase/sulfurtransferase
MSDSPQLPEITPTELKARLDNGDVPLLVDVREHFERRIADLPEHGQLRIPAGEVLHRMHEIASGTEAVIYCRSGSRSAWAVRLLRDRGLDNVVNLKGGVLAWRAEVDPTLQAY